MNDWAGVASLYAEDAVLLPPNTPDVVGRDAILALFESWPPVTEFANRIDEVSGCQDLAVV